MIYGDILYACGAGARCIIVVIASPRIVYYDGKIIATDVDDRSEKSLHARGSLEFIKKTTRRR